MGHAFHRLFSQHFREYSHIPPSRKLQSFLLHDDLKHLLRLPLLQFILREKEHADAVLPLAADPDPQRLCHFLHKPVGDLRQDAHAVAGLTLGVLSGPVL